MRHRFAWVALVAVFGASSAALAQEIPEGQSCGGLLCDMGMFGHKTAREASPSASSPAPARNAVVPAATSPRGAAERAGRTKHVVEAVPAGQHRKRAGKVAAVAPATPTGSERSVRPTPVPPTAPVVAGSRAAPVPAAMVAPASEPVVMMTPYASPPPEAIAPPPVAVAMPEPKPAAEEPVVLANPYVSPQPLAPVFQTVMPALPGTQ